MEFISGNMDILMDNSNDYDNNHSFYKIDDSRQNEVDHLILKHFEYRNFTGPATALGKRASVQKGTKHIVRVCSSIAISSFVLCLRVC